MKSNVYATKHYVKSYIANAQIRDDVRLTKKFLQKIHANF